MTSQYGETSTIVGEQTYKPLDDDERLAPPPFKYRLSGHSAGKRPVNNDFISHEDFTTAERPFFIPIGRGGVSAALEKLDKQLIAVCCS